MEGIIQRGENAKALGDESIPASLFNYKSHWTSLGLNPGLCCKMPDTNCLRHRTAMKD
jgi:hypothetical protein